MKVSSIVLSMLSAHLLDAKLVRREDDAPAEVDEDDAPADDIAAADNDEDDDYEDEYDITDYDEDAMYEDYESSADGWSIHDAWEPIKNFFSHGRHEDTDYYEGSTQVMDWWNDFQDNNYGDDSYDEDNDMELVTRYPIPELNEHGHVDMAELAFRDTLDEYFDIFVIVLSGSILALLGCAAYGRVRNIRYMKKAYGNLDQPKDADEAQNLL